MRILRMTWFCLALLGACVAQAQTAGDTSIRLSADVNAQGQPLVHFWSKVVGAGRANEALRATWQDELRMAHQYDGFEYVRFHGIFHDDMMVYREENGKPVYNFQYVDDVFDRMLAEGVRPFVELGMLPSELATEKNTNFWWKANGSPPTDNAKWVALVRAFLLHCVERYGREEVRRWYFEVWNEPNLRYFFKHGTEAQYFELYRVTALELKGIDPAFRVGGPATSNFRLASDLAAMAVAEKKLEADLAAGKPWPEVPTPLPTPATEQQGLAYSRPTPDSGDWQPVWVKDFLEYCAARHLPVDFVSTHPYPTDFPIDPGGTAATRVRRSVDSTHDDLLTMRKIIDRSAYPKAEIQLTEWNSSPSPLDHSHDSVGAATFIVKANLESAGLVDSLAYWTFTDVFEEERKMDSVFHGGFGLINYQEIVKPAFHGYRFLNRLGDEKLAATTGAIVTRHTDSGRVTAIAYNYPPEITAALPKTPDVEEMDKLMATGSARKLGLSLTGLPPDAVFSVEVLDLEHGNPVAAWEKMGRPEPPNREETRLLKEAAWATAKSTLKADAEGNLKIEQELPPWAVMLVDQVSLP